MKKTILLISTLLIISLSSCNAEDYEPAKSDVQKQMQIAKDLESRQPTPTDIDYSLERYNLIRRTYWVNGQREKASTLVCETERPLGYIVLFSGNATVENFVVDGKVSSLNSFLTPDSEYYELVYGGVSKFHNKWLADVDGSYGENDSGIFFFTPDGKYVEWSGDYLYSDIPFEVSDPIVKVVERNE